MNIIQFVDRYYVSPEALQMISKLPLPTDLIVLILSCTFEKKRSGFQKELMDFVSCRLCHVRVDFERRSFDARFDFERRIFDYGSMFFYDLNQFEVEEENWEEDPSMAMTRRFITQVCRHCSPRYPYGQYTVFTNVEAVSGCSCPLCTTYANLYWLGLKDIEYGI